jgi:hypothetical protein
MRYRFSTRVLFLFVLIVAVASWVVSARIRRVLNDLEVAEAIRKEGGDAIFGNTDDYELHWRTNPPGCFAGCEFNDESVLSLAWSGKRLVYADIESGVVTSPRIPFGSAAGLLVCRMRSPKRIDLLSIPQQIRALELPGEILDLQEIDKLSRFQNLEWLLIELPKFDLELWHWLENSKLQFVELRIQKSLTTYDWDEIAKTSNESFKHTKRLRLVQLATHSVDSELYLAIRSNLSQISIIDIP